MSHNTPGTTWKTWAIIFTTLLLGLTIGCSGSGKQLATVGDLQPSLDTQPANPSDAKELSLDEALAQVEAVNADIQDQSLLTTLKERLSTILEHSGKTKFSSAAVPPSVSQVADLKLTADSSGDALLTWSYANRGDYDQNGEVNASDVTMVGKFWGAKEGDSDWPLASIADGDGNGEINIADVTPIGTNYLAKLDSYVVLALTDPESEEGWTQVGESPLSQSEVPPTGGVRQFFFSLSQPANGTQFGVVSADLMDNGPNSNIVVFDATAAGKPQNVVATQGEYFTRVDLTWDDFDGALSYQVFRADASDSEYTLLGSTPPQTATFSDYTAETHNHYWFEVRALLTDGYSDASDPVEGWPMDTPDAPQNVQASDGIANDSIEVTWDPVPGATTYQVSKAAKVDGPFTALQIVTTTMVDDSDVEWGLPYFYSVQAINPVGVSQSSDVDQGYAGQLGDPPTVMSVTPLTGAEGTLASFSAQLSGNDPDTYQWNFGGAAPNSSDAAPVVLLGQPGQYTCFLTVENAWGSDNFVFEFTVNAQSSDITSVDPTEGIEGTSATFSATNSGGAITSWSWDFGGGATPNTSTAESPTVVLGDVGVYSCSVTVDGSLGESTFYFSLQVLPGLPNITSVSPLEGDVGDGVQFNAVNAGGAITSWQWDFDGGATPDMPTDAQPNVTLGSEGTYDCSVEATNDRGSQTYYFTLTVDPPIPVLTGVSPTAGVSNTTLSISATNIGGAAAFWTWYFGNAATPASSSDESPVITLASPGSYECSVIATNVNGSVIFPFTFTVLEQGPDITSVSPTAGHEQDVKQFTAINGGGAATSWSWDFGGGATPNTSSDTSPSVQLGAAGTYNASVTATNATDSDTYNFTLTVSVLPPDINDVSPQSVVENSTGIQFTANNSGGAATSWAWSFGGGATPNTSTAATPTVTIGSEGSYSCSVTAANGSGSDQYTFTLTVDPAAPLVTAVDPTVGITGASTQFSLTNTGGTISDYQWDFGGGATPNAPTDASPTVTLGDVGTYSCSVYVSNITGSQTFNFTLTVNHEPPNITNVTPQSGTAGAAVTFNLTNTGGPITSYSWDFGGGASPDSSSSASPTVTLGSAGSYSASVTATNESGSDTYSFTLVVSDPT